MSIIHKYTLPKKGRVTGEKRIEKLFSSGSSFISYPLRIVYRCEEKTDSEQISVLVSVSKKRFRRAVKRNRVKRLIREAYRLNKEHYIEIGNKYNVTIDIAFLYLKNELPRYSEISNSVTKAANMLAGELSKKTET